jgi:4-amino-4-deoxy-L-arabinose transferase-like glycosyltransferase
MTSRRTRFTLALLVGILLLGFGLRMFQLYDVPIRGDEVFTIRYWMRQPIAITLANNVMDDPHPPLIIGLYRSWGLLLGGDERIARFLPALLNIIGIAGVYALGKRLGGRAVGLLAALFWAVHPFEIWHAQDARSYGVWGAVNVLTVWLGVRAVSSTRRRDWLLYVLAATAGAYIYYLELFTVAALTLWVFVTYRKQRDVLVRWFVANAAVGLLLAPWFLQPRLLTGSGYGGTTGGFNPGLLLSWFLPTLTFGETLSNVVSTPVAANLWLILLPLLAVALVVWWRRAPRPALLLALIVLIPAAALAVVSLRLSVFTPRYIMSIIPGLLVLIAGLSVWLWQRNKVGRGAALLVSGAWLALSVVSLSTYYFNYTKVPPWPALVNYLEAHAQPDDIVVQAAADEAFNYYLDELAEPFDRKQLPANPRQSPEEITALLDADRETHERMWRVAQTFTDWPSYGIVEGWLDDHMQLVIDTTVSGLRAQQFRRWDVDAARLPATPLATFEDIAVLRSAEVILSASDERELIMVLVWEALADSAAPLTGSVQLIGAVNPASGSPLWSQDDHPPQMGRIATTSWADGALYRDVYTLDIRNVPSGTYDLVVRLYDPQTGERLAVDDSDGASLGSVTIP